MSSKSKSSENRCSVTDSWCTRQKPVKKQLLDSKPMNENLWLFGADFSKENPRVCYLLIARKLQSTRKCCKDNENWENEIDGEIEERERQTLNVRMRNNDDWWMNETQTRALELTWTTMWCTKKQTKTTLKKHHRTKNTSESSIGVFAFLRFPVKT